MALGRDKKKVVCAQLKFWRDTKDVKNKDKKETKKKQQKITTKTTKNKSKKNIQERKKLTVNEIQRQSRRTDIFWDTL